MSSTVWMQIVRPWWLAPGVFLASCTAWNVTPEAVLSGEVVDRTDRHVLTDARLKVEGAPARHVELAEGRFAIEGTAGTVSVRVWAPGHRERIATCRLEAGETRRLRLSLEREGTSSPLHAVLFERGDRVWMVDSDGFSERCLTAELEGRQSDVTTLPGSDRYAYIHRQTGTCQVWMAHVTRPGRQFVADVPRASSDLTWNPLGGMMAFSLPLLQAGLGLVPTLQELDVPTGRTRLIASGGRNEHARYSPDGESLVWARQNTPRPWQLWIAGANGEHPRTINGLRNASEPCFSPGGTQVACVSNLGGASDLYVMGRDGTGARKLTHLPPGGHAADPAWSPDGRRILFTCDIDLSTGERSAAPGLWTWDLAAESPTLLTTAAQHGRWGGEL